MKKFIVSMGVAALFALPAAPSLAATTHARRAHAVVARTHAHTALVAKKHKKHKKHKKVTATAAIRRHHSV